MSDGPARDGASRRGAVIATLGVTQILAWGSSYYLPAVLAKPIAAETGWPLSLVVAGLSLGLVAAGFVSPRVGRAVEETGGRPVLATSSLLLALGLASLAAADHIAVYFAAWAIIGLGMGAGLYDAAFATLGRLYGGEARSAIASLTLFGGFASTICWPLSALLVEAAGWRGACLAYAAIHLCVTLPLHLTLLPRIGASPTPAGLARLLVGSGGAGTAVGIRPVGRRAILFYVLAASLTIGGIASATLSVHLLTVLQARDVALAGAVALGALVGPSQVGARLLEITFGRRFHPIWTAFAAAMLTGAGVSMLALGLPGMALALVLYGGGIGIRSIVRGTLPLALFGAPGYAVLMGRLALPHLLAGALAPLAGAMIIERAGAGALLVILALTSLLDVALVAATAWCARWAAREAVAAPAP